MNKPIASLLLAVALVAGCSRPVPPSSPIQPPLPAWTETRCGGVLVQSDSTIPADKLRALCEVVDSTPFGDTSGTFVIRFTRANDTYQLLVRLKTGIENDPDVMAFMSSLAMTMTKYLGNPCDIHACDAEFRTLRVYIPK